jgi:Protein of unknown function (DUF1579)
MMLAYIRASALMGLIAALWVPSMAAAQDSDPIAKLGVWAGRWTYHAEVYETPYSHAYASDGTQDCGWSPNHGFMVCDYLNSNPAPGSPLTDLGVFSYNPTTKTYTRVSVFQGSKPFVQDVTIDGNIWTTSATIPYKGKTLIHRDVYVYQSADKRTTTTQLSADGGATWITVEKFTALRVSQ